MYALSMKNLEQKWAKVNKLVNNDNHKSNINNPLSICYMLLHKIKEWSVLVTTVPYCVARDTTDMPGKSVLLKLSVKEDIQEIRNRTWYDI